MMEPAIFFAGPPNLKDLCCLSVFVPTSVNLCVMQAHIVRCREIIFTEPDVLASPTLDMDATFHIVLQQSLYKSGRLQMRLQKHGMQISKPFSVHLNMYQSCLTYTIIARLSPQWNKAGDWMIQGRDFVNHDGYTNALKMNICVNREEIYIALSGTVVRFPPLQVEDLNLSRSEMLALLKSTEGEPGPVELIDAWCHVLPSMKRGKIASLALSIPKESPFASYKELKRHWKNMYGYRLPDTDEDILYCQIGFLSSGGGKHYTYPNVCLRGGPLHVVPRVDPKPVLTAFLQDLYARVASVCGMALKFQPKLRYAAPALHSSSMPPARENLSAKQMSKQNGPTRDEESIARLFMSKNTNRAPLSERLQRVEKSQACTDDSFAFEACNTPTADVASIKGSASEPYQRETIVKNTHSMHTSPTKTSHDSKVLTQVSNQDEEKTIKMSLQSHLSALSQNAPKLQTHKFENNSTASSKKFVPLFWPKMKIQKNQASSVESKKSHKDLPQPAGNTMVPMFKVHKTQKLMINSNSIESSKKSSSQKSQPDNILSSCSKSSTSQKRNNCISFDSNICATPQQAKLFSCNQDDNSNSFYNLNDIVCIGSATHSHKITGALNAEANRPQSLSSSVLKSQFKPHQGKTQMSSPASKCKKSQNSFGVSLNGILNTGQKTSMKEPNILGLNPGNSTPRLAMSAKHGDSTYDDEFECLIGTLCPIGVKRKQGNQADTPVKKMSSKPQVQKVDVEALAKTNQLSKVNTVTLIAWLKEKKVACKSKDRKSDLVDKVNSFLHLPTTQ